MGFFKDFKRDFAQAVNELMPDTESKEDKKKKKAGEEMVYLDEAGEATREEAADAADESDTKEVISELEGVTEAASDIDVKDAVSEAILREEAERLRVELGRSIDEEARRASEEIETEIDNLPDAAPDDINFEYDEASEDESAEGADEGRGASESDAAYDETGSITEIEAVEGLQNEADSKPQDSDTESNIKSDTDAMLREETDGETTDNRLQDLAETADEAAAEYISVDIAEIKISEEDISGELAREDLIEAERINREVLAAEEARILEEERMRAAELHAEEEAERKKREAEKKNEKTASEKKKRKTRTAVKEVSNKMPDLETEISNNDAYSGMSGDTTYITGKTTIVGNIDTEDDIDIMGRVDGDITCSGKLITGGRINGRLRVHELYANQAHISGDIIAEGSVKIGAGTISVGNINAESAVIAGAVKGDVDVREQVIVDSSAVVVGNIRSKSIQVNAGAIVDGMCQQIYSDVNLDKFFDEEIEDLDVKETEETGEAAENQEIENLESLDGDLEQISAEDTEVTASDEAEAEFEKSEGGKYPGAGKEQGSKKGNNKRGNRKH